MPTIFGHVLFDGLDGWHVAALFAVYLFAYFVKGVFGAGNLVLMVLLSALIIPPHHAVVLAVAATCFAQLQFIRDNIRYADWSIARSVIFGTYAGLAIGVWIFGRLDGTWLTILLGTILGLLIIADMTRGLSHVADKLDFRQKSVLYPTMLTFGMISGLGGAGTLSGIAFYIKQISPDARTLRNTIMMLGITFAFWRVFLFAITGYLTWTIMIEVAILLPPMLLCGYLGARLFRRLPDKRYYQYLQMILLVIAVILAIKGVIKVLSGA